MASLALAAAVVILSLWGLAAVSLLMTCFGFLKIGAVFGILSVAAGAWLLCILPHAPFVGLVNLSAGGFAVWAYAKNRS